MDTKTTTESIKKTSLELLQKGTSIEDMESAIQGFEEEEMHEAAQGVRDAIAEFDNEYMYLQD